MIELNNITKIYKTGEVHFKALDNVSLKIGAGEFTAIMGASGSGKSTLLNILGFLDKPDSGEYLFQGKDISRLSDDDLSVFRNHIAGFVFQQFHLLPRLSAVENAQLPLIYAGKGKEKKAVKEKLEIVGLSHRESHPPSEMSGGEQQRVAIARSLVNEPLIIFADEPTGNLDSKNEKEIMAILKRLNEEGKTIIMVTHENSVAKQAKRIIRMKDGKIISDSINSTGAESGLSSLPDDKIEISNPALDGKGSSFGQAEFIDFMLQAFRSILTHKLRSFLSMFGILIGVAAVISMIALGEGAKQSIAERMSSLGSNIVTVRPGAQRTGGVMLQAGSVTRIEVEDAIQISRLKEVKNVTPNVTERAQLVYQNKNWNSQVQGVGTGYEEMRSAKPVAGRFFTEQDILTRNRVALIGLTVVKELFENRNPLGKEIKINRINFTVIGVLPERGSSPFMDQDDVVIVPYSTAMYRLFGKTYIDSIDVEVKSTDLISDAIDSIQALIIKRHRLTGDNVNSFHIRDSTEFREAMASTTRTMTMLLGSVAAISLVVGGIGIMNIMLVSVKERTKEIGLRKAIGARRRDILSQFLIESVLMTFTGGLAGILLGVGVSALMTAWAGWAVKISLYSIVLSTGFSVLIGFGFGFYPAMQASKLNPIEALRYD